MTATRQEENKLKIVQWLQDEGFFRGFVEDPNSFVNIVANLPQDRVVVNVVMPLGKTDAAIVITKASLTEEQKNYLNNRTEEIRNFLWDLRFSLLNLNVGFNFEPDFENLDAIRIHKPIYYDGLSKDRLIDVMTEVKRALILVLWKFEKDITPYLMVKCKKCGHIHRSGIQMDRESYKSTTLSNNTEYCPNCREPSTYSKGDYFFS